MVPVREVTDACVHWVIRRAEEGLSPAQVARRAQQMTPTQIREARAEHARASTPKET